MVAPLASNGSTKDEALWIKQAESPRQSSFKRWNNMWLPGVQEDWIQRRVHGPDHVVHPVRRCRSTSDEGVMGQREWWTDLVLYRGLMRLATLMMSLRLAGALTFAPEPIVMATSFSVKVWQICMWKWYVRISGYDYGPKIEGKAVRNAMTFRMEMQWETNPLWRKITEWIP